MPDEYVRSGILYFCKKGREEDVQDVLNKLELIYENYYLTPDKQKDSREAHMMKNINHFFINSIVGQNEDSKKLFIRQKYHMKMFFGRSEEDFKTGVEESYWNYRKIKKIRNEMNHAQSSENNNKGFFVRMNRKMQEEPEGSEKYRVFDNQSRQSSQDVINMINRYLDAWEALASQVPAKIKANVADIS